MFRSLFCPFKFKTALFSFEVITGITFGRKSTILCVLLWIAQSAELETRIFTARIHLGGDIRKHRKGVRK